MTGFAQGYYLGYGVTWIAMSLLVGLYGKSRTIGFWAAFILSILLSPLVGLIVAACTKRIDTTQYRYKEYYEIAKKEEFKGNLAVAIDKYQDALYYLKNDHNNLPKKQAESYNSLIASIEAKIDELKGKVVQ